MVTWGVIRRSRAADWVVRGSLAAIAVCASQFPLLASQMPSAQNAPVVDEDPRTIIRSLTGHAGAVLGDSLIVAGGIWGRDHASLTNALSFRLPGNWSAGARTLGARDFPGMASLRGRIYLVGGMSRRDIWMGSVLSWDGRSEAWRTHPQLPTPRNRLACVGAGEFLYAIGGMDRHGTSAACERFDPAADRWTTLAPMPTARHAHVADRGRGADRCARRRNECGHRRSGRSLRHDNEPMGVLAADAVEAIVLWCCVRRRLHLRFRRPVGEGGRLLEARSQVARLVNNLVAAGTGERSLRFGCAQGRTGTASTRPSGRRNSPGRTG